MSVITRDSAELEQTTTLAAQRVIRRESKTNSHSTLKSVLIRNTPKFH